MQLFLKIPPLREPITIEETKLYLRINSDQENDFLNTLIRAARRHIETVTGRSLIRQQWLMTIKPPYPLCSPLVKREGKLLEVTLPQPPLLEVEVVTTGDIGVPYTVEDNRVLLSSNVCEKELTLVYWAGYGETADALPPDLKMAVLMMARFFYDHQKADLSFLRPYKTHHLR
ncbi:MAG: head-tail connector protein [Alphaproteobacteria bacterium]|nr:head-tail connector protein [Alphaproteobacteria bacterium]